MSEKITKEEKAAKRLAQAESFIGKRFGKLIVSKFIGLDEDSHRVYECTCDCGKTKKVSLHNLLNGHTTSCGCSKRQDLTSLTFGELTVVEFAYSKNGKAYWKTECSCGKTKDVSADNLRRGKVTSCGHLRKGRTRKTVTAAAAPVDNIALNASKDVEPPKPKYTSADIVAAVTKKTKTVSNPLVSKLFGF